MVSGRDWLRVYRRRTSGQKQMIIEEKEMEARMNRMDVSFSTFEEHEKEERDYWSNASVEDKLRTITYLRECFYGPEATTGKVQRVYKFVKRQ